MGKGLQYELPETAEARKTSRAGKGAGGPNRSYIDPEVPPLIKRLRRFALLNADSENHDVAFMASCLNALLEGNKHISTSDIVCACGVCHDDDTPDEEEGQEDDEGDGEETEDEEEEGQEEEDEEEDDDEGDEDEDEEDE